MINAELYYIKKLFMEWNGGGWQTIVFIVEYLFGYYIRILLFLKYFSTY